MYELVGSLTAGPIKAVGFHQLPDLGLDGLLLGFFLVLLILVNCVQYTPGMLPVEPTLYCYSRNLYALIQ